MSQSELKMLGENFGKRVGNPICHAGSAASAAACFQHPGTKLVGAGLVSPLTWRGLENASQSAIERSAGARKPGTSGLFADEPGDESRTHGSGQSPPLLGDDVPELV